MDSHGGVATLPEVLKYLPRARTGDVIGLWLLAARHGAVDEDAESVILVETRRGVRQVAMPYVVFGETVPDPVGPRTVAPPVVPPTPRAEGLFDV